jgi:glycosyltransferase involved in cell wall biosynthesis
MAKIIINASNLKGGGALQVAITFMEGLKEFKRNKYYVFLPPVLFKSIDFEKFANNIVELYTNKLLYKKVVRNAKSRFLDKFTPEKMAIKYMDEIILLKNKESE